MRQVFLVPVLAAATVFAIVSFHRSARAADTAITATQLQALVDRAFSDKPNYQPGDLISRGDVEPIINAMIDRGLLTTANMEDLYDSFLPDNNTLVRMLSTPTGKVFMRKVSKKPEIYDRLERLSWMPGGRDLLSVMIASPTGTEMLDKLLTEDGLQALAQQFRDDSRVENFMLPTGHVHTTDELATQLGVILGKTGVK